MGSQRKYEPGSLGTSAASILGEPAAAMCSWGISAAAECVCRIHGIAWVPLQHPAWVSEQCPALRHCNPLSAICGMPCCLHAVCTVCSAVWWTEDVGTAASSLISEDWQQHGKHGAGLSMLSVPGGLLSPQPLVLLGWHSIACHFHGTIMLVGCNRLAMEMA